MPSKRKSEGEPTLGEEPDNSEFEDMWEDDVETDEEIIENADDQMEEVEPETHAYLPTYDLKEDEELVVDPSTYEMLHSMTVEWPCLSFDIVEDSLGKRGAYPLTTFMVGGSQADEPRNNKLYVMKVSNMYKTRVDSDCESDDEDVDEDPILEYKTISYPGGVNRLRTKDSFVASMCDDGKVYIHDISKHLASFDTPGLLPPKACLMHTITAHSVEGYALDWSKNQLLTGDCAGKIFLSTFDVNFSTGSPFTSHTSSVEDLQWSPTQSSIFASCSSDKTIKIWDTRTSTCQLSIQAHTTDVNVISWNRTTNDRCVDYLLASGSDSGEFSIWDLRTWSSSPVDPAATFSWHKQPITSIEWNPNESSVVAASSHDQLTLWDLALERDQEEGTVMLNADGKELEVPPQLLFIHQGQKFIKELHWHKQIPGVLCSTAYDGFNLFKTINS